MSVSHDPVPLAVDQSFLDTLARLIEAAKGTAAEEPVAALVAHIAYPVHYIEGGAHAG